MKFLDLIDPAKSDIRYTRMTFPDGQPHFALVEPFLTSPDVVEVLCRITSAADIVDVGLAMDALLSASMVSERVPSSISLNVAYMLGARMDRRIDPGTPYTLDVLARLLKVAASGVDIIRVLDPHSSQTLAQLWDYERDSPTHAVAIPPDRLVKLALDHFGPDATIVVPDAGAITRTLVTVERLGLKNPIARCEKKRDPQTGNLSGFALVEGDVNGRDCLIVDDLCDGGGTFAGISDVLRARGAKRIGLCVTHGIFSKGLPIAGIDAVYCTDSFVSLPGVGVAPTIYGKGDGEVFFRLHAVGIYEPFLYVLTDFLRDEVRALHEG
jgi:ribose-phosphate pyrophosphokinase